MYLYWRVQQDLEQMGNVLVLHNPNMIREFKKWVTKNRTGLLLANGLKWDDLGQMCLCPN